MIERQKLDWELAQQYVESIPNQEHTRLHTTSDLPHEEDKYYTFKFGEHDPNRPMGGFPIATYRGEDGALYVSQTRYNHHTITAASAGSGKTQGVVLNYAFNADPRMSHIFADPKGEILKASYARLCEVFGKDNVLVANFLDPSHTMLYFNPFTTLAYEWLDSACKKNKKAIRDNIISELKKIFEILCPVESDKDKSWERTAQSFLLGIVLGLFEDLTLTDKQEKKTGRHRTTPEMINFSTLIKVYNSFKWSERGCFEDGGFLSTRKKDSLAYTSTYSVISNASTTRSNYLGFVDLYLNRLSDPKILEISRCNNMNVSALSESPKVLFLVYDITHEATRDYMNFCIAAKLIAELLEISHKQAAPLHTPVHFVLDEFATLRPCPVYPNLLATGRGSNIFMHMIVQSLEQLHARYPAEWETMIDNSDAQLFLGSNSIKTAEQFANSLGVTTVLDPEAFLRGEFRVVQKPIVSLDTLLHRMKRGEAFIRVNNAQPIHGGFELYYKTSEYTAYPTVNPSELESPLPKISESRCGYRLPKKRDADDLDIFDDDEDEDECLEEETQVGLQDIFQWTEIPFVYDKSDSDKRDDFAMDRIENLVRLDRYFNRQDVIELLKILKKLNTVDENNDMLDILLHEFSIATDEEYEKLRDTLFDDEE